MRPRWIAGREIGPGRRGKMAATRVLIGNVHVPRAFTVRNVPDPGEPQVTIEVEVRHNWPEARTVVVEAAPDGQRVRGVHLREINIDDDPQLDEERLAQQQAA